VPDQVELGHLSPLWARLTLRDRRAGGHDEHVWVAQQLHRLERAVSERQIGERQVEVSAFDEASSSRVVRRTRSA